MLFGHKPVDELTQEELLSLIGMKENEFLEFKLKYNFSASKPPQETDDFEVLKDIASIANAGGGYIFIGVRADSNSVAVRFESLGNDCERLRQKILALAVEHIEERISGLEVKERIVGIDKLIVIRIPSSERIPHMVAFNHNTHFTRRYQEGKREMTFVEIRNAFNNDLTERRLAAIEQSMRLISGRSSQSTNYFSHTSISDLASGIEVANECLDDFLEQHPVPSFFIAIGPRHPRAKQLDLTSTEVSKFLRTGNIDDRNLGWNMALVPRTNVKQNSARIDVGDPNVGVLSLLANGFMMFSTPLDERFCWSQSSEEFAVRPRFSSYAVVEFPVSFLRMYRSLREEFRIQDDEYCVVLCYHKVNGYHLAPGHPNNPFWDTNSRKYGDVADLIITDTVTGNSSVDDIAYKLLSNFYGKFGFDERTIPFFDDEKSVFVIR